jgi:hypothetical protein
VAGIDEHVEGAGGLHGNAEPDLPQALDHVAPAFVIVAFMCATSAWAQDSAAMPAFWIAALAEMKKFWWIFCRARINGSGRDHIAQPQAGHGKKLGKAVDHKGPVGEFQDAVGPALINQAMVDLVRHHIGPHAGNRPHAVGREQGAGGIGRRVDENGPGAIGNVGLDGFGGVLKPVGFVTGTVTQRPWTKLMKLG